MDQSTSLVYIYRKNFETFSFGKIILVEFFYGCMLTLNERRPVSP